MRTRTLLVIATLLGICAIGVIGCDEDREVGITQNVNLAYQDTIASDSLPSAMERLHAIVRSWYYYNGVSDYDPHKLCWDSITSKYISFEGTRLSATTFWGVSYSGVPQLVDSLLFYEDWFVVGSQPALPFINLLD